MRRNHVVAAILILLILLGTMAPGLRALVAAQGNAGTRLFPETGNTVAGRFLQYWQQNGGLAQQGYPISDEFAEYSPTDGKLYTMQFFERAVFEYHPENNAPYDVLLSRLGSFEYKSRYGAAGTPVQRASSDNAMLFPQTGRALSGKFRQYWDANGGLAQQGYPISDEFQEVSPLDGKTYTVQYFERAVFEWHPENAGTPYEVLLSQLGKFSYRDTYINPKPVIPADPLLYRSGLHGSSSFLAWTEWSKSPEGFIARDTGDVMGYDLGHNKIVPVTSGQPNDQVADSLVGSLVLWHSQSAMQYGGLYNCYARDLATGVSYDVETGPEDCYGVATDGKSVVWSDISGLLLKDLATGETSTITTVQAGSQVSLFYFAISPEYVVWTELASFGRNQTPIPSYIRAYNRKTSEIRIVQEFTAPNGSGLAYALDGHHLALSDAEIRVIDLDNGNTVSLGAEKSRPFYRASDLSLHDDVLIWSSVPFGREGDPDIWGMKLSEMQPVPLVIGAGWQTGMLLGDGRMAWIEGNGSPNEGGIGIASLSSLFATAADRLKALQ